jgi:hypothetical protein
MLLVKRYYGTCPAIGHCAQISKQAENQAQWPVPDMLHR